MSSLSKSSGFIHFVQAKQFSHFSYLQRFLLSEISPFAFSNQNITALCDNPIYFAHLSIIKYGHPVDSSNEYEFREELIVINQFDFLVSNAIISHDDV